MKDIQSQYDFRRISIRKVGVKTITYPIRLLDKAHKTQQTVASVNMYVNLPHRFKGTHMSRFIEILNRFHGKFNLKTLHLILEEMKARLDAEAAHLEMAFPYFLQQQQMSLQSGLAPYDCRLHGSLSEGLDLMVEVDVPVPLFYPANAAGTTNAFTGIWGVITVSVRMNRFLWIEDLIGLVQEGGGSPVGVPESVESLCRRVSTVLSASQTFNWYKVVVKSIVSGYATFASAEWPEPSADRGK